MSSNNTPSLGSMLLFGGVMGLLGLGVGLTTKITYTATQCTTKGDYVHISGCSGTKINGIKYSGSNIKIHNGIINVDGVEQPYDIPTYNHTYNVEITGN